MSTAARRSEGGAVRWIREGIVPLPQAPGGEDASRALRPSVLELPDGTIRLWYTGSDGASSSILAAIRQPGRAWETLGVAVQAGMAGGSDSYGVESPSVVSTPGGFLMAYGGFDGETTRLHMATSDDGDEWHAQGTIMQRGDEDAVGASDPCVLATAARWWLFYTAVRDPIGRRPSIAAAVSASGASWDRVGNVLEAEEGEIAVSHPCVLEISRTMYAFYSADVGGSLRIAMATSADGVNWNRRGTILEPTGSGPDGASVLSPCVLRARDGGISMWYAGLPMGDEGLGYRICFARFPGPWAS
jgi:predicted GH43/DUF377 family glycosyl hydrolase